MYISPTAACAARRPVSAAAQRNAGGAATCGRAARRASSIHVYFALIGLYPAVVARLLRAGDTGNVALVVRVALLSAHVDHLLACAVMYLDWCSLGVVRGYRKAGRGSQQQQQQQRASCSFHLGAATFHMRQPGAPAGRSEAADFNYRARIHLRDGVFADIARADGGRVLRSVGARRRAALRAPKRACRSRRAHGVRRRACPVVVDALDAPSARG